MQFLLRVKIATDVYDVKPREGNVSRTDRTCTAKRFQKECIQDANFLRGRSKRYWLFSKISFAD